MKTKKKKFKRFTHEKGVTTIHFKSRDEGEAFLVVLPFILGIICLAIFIGGLLLIGPM